MKHRFTKTLSGSVLAVALVISSVSIIYAGDLGFEEIREQTEQSQEDNSFSSSFNWSDFSFDESMLPSINSDAASISLESQIGMGFTMPFSQALNEAAGSAVFDSESLFNMSGYDFGNTDFGMVNYKFDSMVMDMLTNPSFGNEDIDLKATNVFEASNRGRFNDYPS